VGQDQQLIVMFALVRIGVGWSAIYISDARSSLNAMKRLKTTMQAMVALSPGCLEAVRLQLESSDHLLPPPARRLWLHNHLMPCKGCRRYDSQIQFFGNASQQETRPALPPPTLTG